MYNTICVKQLILVSLIIFCTVTTYKFLTCNTVRTVESKVRLRRVSCQM